MKLARIRVPERAHLDWVTVFGLGHLRPAPGTWGSIPPVVVAWLLYAAHLTPHHLPAAYYLVMGGLFLWACAACIFQGDHAEARWGKDPSYVVADETAGQCIPLMALPLAGVGADADWKRVTIATTLAFLLFRIMDIVKPPPARGIQKLPAGWGILVDDLIAGVYAAVALVVVSRWL